MDCFSTLVVCLMLTYRTTSGFYVQPCDEHNGNDCNRRPTSESRSVDDMPNSPEISSVGETIKVFRFNPSLLSAKEVSLIVPEWTRTTQPEPQFATTSQPEPEPTNSTDIQDLMQQLVAEVKEKHKRVQELEAFKDRILEKIDRAEQDSRITNVIFTNVRESRNESLGCTLQKVLYILNHFMRVETEARDIKEAFRTSSVRLAGFRPIVVSFTNFMMKLKVLAARDKLAVANKRRHTNIQVVEDYSEMVTQRRKELRPFLLQKKSQGHNAFIVYDKLVVDGVKMTLKDLKAEKIREQWKKESRKNYVRHIMKKRSAEVDKDYYYDEDEEQ